MMVNSADLLGFV